MKKSSAILPADKIKSVGKMCAIAKSEVLQSVREHLITSADSLTSLDDHCVGFVNKIGDLMCECDTTTKPTATEIEFVSYLREIVAATCPTSTEEHLNV